MSRLQQRSNRPVLLSLAIGALVPLFWGVMGFVFFSVPEGWFSRLFWRAVYITCPFWMIEGNKAIILMPVLNGLMYALLAWVCMQTRRLVAAAKPSSN